MRDFTHIAYIGGPPNVFVVNPSLGVRSLKDLVELGRRGQAIDYVSPGVGTLGHLLAELFAQRTGIKLQQIMTRGASQGLMDLVAGTVHVGTMTWTSALGQIRAGKVIPIAVTSSGRLAEFPDLADLQGSGLRRPDGSLVVCTLRAGRAARGCHAQAQSGGRENARATRRAQAHGA